MSAATVATEADGPDPSESVGPPRRPARARLTSLTEPPTEPLLPPGPLIAPPPPAGSGEALARTPARGDDRPNPAVPPRRPRRAGQAAGAVADTELPDPTPLCCAMVQAAVEALRGARPLAQLARWVSPEIYEQLEMRSALTQRVQGRSAGKHRASIRRIRLCRLGDNAAEATVVVDDGPRVRAVAVRLEGHRGQWRATALEIG